MGKVTLTRLHGMAAVVLLVTLLMDGLYWTQLLDSQVRVRTETSNQIGLRAQQLADAVAWQARATVGSVDLALRHLRDHHSSATDAAGLALAAEAARAALPAGYVVQIALIDATGYLAWSSSSFNGKVFLGDREHFKVHRAGGVDRLYISKPLQGRVSGRWSIQFSRALYRAGAFAGVAVISISPEVLSNTLGDLTRDSEDIITWLLADGTYLARNRDIQRVLGKAVPSDRPFLQDDAPPRGVQQIRGVADGVLRMYAWHRLDDLPLIVNVGINHEAILAPLESELQQSRLRNGIGMGLISVLAVIVALLLLRTGLQHKQLQERERRYRALFENNSAVKLLVDPSDGRIVDANSAALDFYGWDLAALTKLHLQDLCALPAERLLAEEASALRSNRRHWLQPHRLANGELRQVEIHVGPVELDGKALSYLIVHDITERYLLDQRLAESEHRHRMVLEAMAEGVFVVDTQGLPVMTNHVAGEILGVRPGIYNRKEVSASDANGHRLAPAEFPSMRAIRGEVTDHETFYISNHEGRSGWFNVSAQPLFSTEGTINGAVISLSDVSALRRAEEGLHMAQMVFDLSAEAIVVLDGDGRVLKVNPAFSAITGFSSTDAVGRRPADVWSGIDQQTIQEARSTLAGGNHWRGEVQSRRRDGSQFTEDLTLTARIGPDGRPAQIVALFSDITERKQSEARIWRQANFDALTGLPSRPLLEDRVAQAIAQARRKDSLTALLFLDLDKFKPVNDLYGHAVGDELLRQVAQRLRSMLRQEDTIARLGGDEFVAVLPDIAGPEAAERAAEKIVASLSAPFTVAGRQVEISVSVGIAFFPRDADNARDLIERADRAMYEAKEAGRATWRGM
ncbi:MAG TPA: diguanylate cyclase [Rhodocyclaceae bacterium]